MLSIIIIACVIVLFAMIIDLISGINKAKQRGEVRSSYGLKRSLNKFISYEGGMMIAACMDILIHFSNIYKLLKLEAIYGVPVVTCIVGLFLCIVEYRSIREKADEKTRNELQKVEEIAQKVINKEDLTSAMASALKQAILESKNNEE
ncbi:MAG: phage holin family protein [Bacteroidales bacterium]|nr:phage holin family protein [Bacteroidales bacterium]